jgi:hypothetical protein
VTPQVIELVISSHTNCSCADMREIVDLRWRVEAIDRSVAHRALSCTLDIPDQAGFRVFLIRIENKGFLLHSSFGGEVDPTCTRIRRS